MQQTQLLYIDTPDNKIYTTNVTDVVLTVVNCSNRNASVEMRFTSFPVLGLSPASPPVLLPFIANNRSYTNTVALALQFHPNRIV